MEIRRKVPAAQYANPPGLPKSKGKRHPVKATSGRGKVVDNEFKNYWTRTPEGLSQWSDKPHPWTSLYRHILDHVKDPDKAKRITSAWFISVFHETASQHAAHMKGRSAALATGGMIALVPSQADAQRLAVDGGEPVDQLHVTLVYLGDAAGYPAYVRELLYGVVAAEAEDLSPITADGFAVSLFNPGTEDACVVLGLSGGGLGDIHDTVTGKVAEALGLVGVDMPEQHEPYTPHITAAYGDDPAVIKEVAAKTGPVTFDRIRLAFAGDVIDVPLGSPVERADWNPDLHPRRPDGKFGHGGGIGSKLADVVGGHGGTHPAVAQFIEAHPGVRLSREGPSRYRVNGVDTQRGWRRNLAISHLAQAADEDGVTLVWHDPAFSKGDRHTALGLGFRAEDGVSHDTADTLVRAPGSHGYPAEPEPEPQPVTLVEAKGGRKPAAKILDDYDDDADRGEVEQAMAEVMNGTYGDLTVRALGGSTVTDDGSVSVGAHVLDSGGEQVGEVRRLIGRDADGNLFAEHVLLQLDSQVRGQRFAEEFNAHLEDWYRESGVGRIETHADIDVGGYAWARAGYDFRDGHVPQDVQRRIRAEINSGDLSPGEERELEDLLSRAVAGQAVGAYELSQAGRRSGDIGRDATWPGKRIMLGSDWRGVKWL